MDLWLDNEIETPTDPLDTVEAVITGDGRFMCQRAEDGDVHFSFNCSWGEIVGYFAYREELPALELQVERPLARRLDARLARVAVQRVVLVRVDAAVERLAEQVVRLTVLAL